MTDLRMAGKDGRQVVNEIRELNSEQKIAVISGWPQHEIVDRFAAGAAPDYVLHKPARFEDLQNVFRSLESQSASATQ